MTFAAPRQLPVLDLFSAAAGGWSLGMHRAGYRTVAACEVIAWRRAIYAQNNLGVRIYDDVRTLTADRLVRDGVELPWIVVGSPPCQDISPANTKGKGVDGERSGLYFEAVRLIGECRPRWFAFENSANLRTRGADRIIPELEELGYAVWPFVVRASDVGANHERARSWVIGFNQRDIPYPNDQSEFRRSEHAEMGVVPPLERDASDATSDGRGSWRARGRSQPDARLSEQTCWDAHSTSQRYESWRSRGHRPDGDGTTPVAASTGDPANANQARQPHGQVEPGLRQAQEPDDGRGSGWGHDGQSDSEMGRSQSVGQPAPEPWADWNGGLAHHLRLDDGLSAWVAGTRIAVGGPRGTSAASLIVEAFGDAVIPQIPEAIGRAISRVESALSAVRTVQ